MHITRLGLLIFMAALIGGCANRPDPAPQSSLPPSQPASPAWFSDSQLASLLPVEILLLGEQHDAHEHHLVERLVVDSFIQRKQLATLVLEMADAGTSTVALPAGATEVEVKKALAWDERDWPWTDYGSTVMTAVRAGVPVIGGNLPKSNMRTARDDVSLDVQLSGPALKAQQQAIRKGHCDQLPESQITPMTRIQIARDRAMAHVLAESVVPGKVVLLIAGAGHTDKYLGVPQHLPNTVTSRSVQMRPDTPAGPETRTTAQYDAIWATPAVPAKDYCANAKIGK